MSTRAQSRAVVAIATAVALTFGVVFTGAPANAAVGGNVSGKVLVEFTPGMYLPFSSVEVMFFPLWGSGDPEIAVTDAYGEYEISGLEQGDYRVLFRPPVGSPYVSTWRDGESHEAGSAVLSLGADNVLNVDASLAVGGTISGTITSSSMTDRGAAAAFLYDQSTGEWERYSRWANADAMGNYTIRGLNDGEYLLRFAGQGESSLISTEYWDDSIYWSTSDAVTISGNADLTAYNAQLVVDGINLDRIEGPNRYATSVAVSELGWGDFGSDAVFIVNGRAFPDALSAGPAAARLAAPLLLTAPETLSAEVATRLEELDPAFIFIIGGTPSVSATVQSQLEAYASDDVIRISGANRYETSRLVAQVFFDSADTAYIATGSNFPDALSAGPAAANEHGPVILVPGSTSTAGPEIYSLLDDLGVSKVVIAGGEPSVSAAIEAEIRSSEFIDEVYRRAGVNRYDTALQISQGSFPFADGVLFATGLGFPDALAGAALAGNPVWRNPILLVRTECVPPGVNEEITRLKPADIFLLGGLPSIGNGVVNNVPC